MQKKEDYYLTLSDDQTEFKICIANTILQKHCVGYLIIILILTLVVLHPDTVGTSWVE